MMSFSLEDAGTTLIFPIPFHFYEIVPIPTSTHYSPTLHFLPHFPVISIPIPLT